ncbi:MAG: ABC transporter permease subunit [Gammaproteobacteria bacterium]|nr:ABC transporter permease subunit [Gammaproteobacteria bacterium]
MSSKLQKSSAWHQQRRLVIDNIARYGIGLGGLSVILAIVLIFFYLLWVVLPMFSSVAIQTEQHYQVPSIESGNTVLLLPEESGTLGLRITDQAQAVFFDIKKGDVSEVLELALPENTKITGAQLVGMTENILALELDKNKLFFIKLSYRVSFVNNLRVLTPDIEYPYEDSFISFESEFSQVSISRDEAQLTLSLVQQDGDVKLYRYEIEEGDAFDEAVAEVKIDQQNRADYMLLDAQGLWLYLSNQQGEVSVFDISDSDDVSLVSQTNILPPNEKLAELKILLGGMSLLAADQHGGFSQWSLQRDASNNYSLKRVRGFENDNKLLRVQSEHRRKGVLALDEKGNLLIYHTTADNLLAKQHLSDLAITHFSLSTRANLLLHEDERQQIVVTRISNEHPELSWSALWNEVTYEGYSEPDYIWQSSSADNDFEPKFSLVPLAFGTLKAAFYAMLFATPLAIMGAIYTAYFMSSGMRSWVKPGIEIMEALPTVILGFLAGLWLAPVVENNLTGIISILLIVPPGILLFAVVWQKLPRTFHHLIPPGLHAAILMPVIAALVWLAIGAGPLIEGIFFNGSLRVWMESEFGVGYDQRNSLVVGIAMGLAVIPTIFSITEDAIFSVPKYLTQGSLALGATPWQTLTRVVLLTASPGIFSAVMIGLGRAVGETMIVLMATGNTAVIDFSIFEGMRTLSANVAVELPESEIDSSHYRILFLAAFVLFVVTFFFNTAAEIVRQRLRKQYGSL